MNQVFDFFKPEALFSTDNPFIKSAQKSHQLFADSFEKAARAQVALASDLLDLNRKRLDSLYDSNSVADKLTAQQAIVTEAGNLTTEWAAGVQDIVTEYQAGITESANELVELAAQKPVKKTTRKAKAA